MGSAVRARLGRVSPVPRQRSMLAHLDMSGR